MSTAAAQSQDDFIPAFMRPIAPYWALMLVVLAAYGNIFGNVFVYDDKVLIILNEYLRGWDHIGDILTGSTQSGAHMGGGFYRPMQMLLYLFAFHLGAGATFFFHLLNLSLHMANTCFVYRLGTKLRFKPWGVFLAALVWGLHPLHTEAVTYMSATADPLFTFFCLWAIIILLPDFTPRKILQIMPLFLLALLSKEAAVMFPLLVMACLFLTNPQRLNVRTYFCTWPLWSITLIYATWRLHADNFFGTQSAEYFAALSANAALREYAYHPAYRIYTFLATLPDYLDLLVWPQNLHMERGFPFYNLSLHEVVQSEPVMMGLGIVLLAAAQIIRSSKKPEHGIEMSWGLLWFAAAHSPDSGILSPMNSLFLEHWMYLPSVGLFLGTGETLAKILQNRPRLLVFACSSIALIFAGSMFSKTHEQNKIWHDPVSFYNNIIRYNQRSAAAYGSLGVYYSQTGDYFKAIEQFKRSVEISDSRPDVRYAMARAYLQLPDWTAHIPDAITNLQRSLEMDPNFYRSDQTLGSIYDYLGDKDKAKYYHDRADAILAQHQ
ncbi:hypothetical protein LMG28614_05625 [Paraburkholderia ultramafica]|uniref:Uncharacterized protein n=1 Tax=Paraburkholderia ultramafica TaxID=1544867 RepID=A0A6S7BK28_9BURK|nr:tetratricopeptide repeat protein [Paraburkholderia ultramafica]CAB3802506.1 hypothetical protein LMG28614_05625 [Paraburkholderia ultramafica]